VELQKIDNITHTFDSISLSEMESVNLMKRVDTKFAISESQFLAAFPSLSSTYRILDVNNNKFSEYDSLYFDSPHFKFYSDHHRSKANRMKIRIRKYNSNQVSFLEVKKKFKGRTIKSRITSNTWSSELSEADQEFLTKFYPKYDSLSPSLENNFIRITLVNNNKTERLTFDLNINYKSESKKMSLSNLVICELKQEKLNRKNAFFAQMKQNQIRPLRISKYCVGMMGFYSDNGIKSNRFKKKTLKLNKILC